MDHEEDENRAFPLPHVREAQKGRGAVSNLQGRYERQLREEEDDGWQHAEGKEESHGTPPRKTYVVAEHAKSILSRNASPDLPFHVTLNPYRVLTPTE